MKRKGSGWKGESRRHSLARKGIKTNLPDGKRFDVSKFVAKGYPYIVDQIDDGEYRVLVVNDDDPLSPREWDNLGHMVCWHRRYKLGDEQPNEDPQEWLEELREMYGDKVEILPLYLYDHSGITMNTTGYSHMGMHGHFDSGQVGWIYVTHEQIKKDYGKLDAKTLEKVRSYLKGEVELYDDYLTGNVYGFIVEKRKKCDSCDFDDWEQIDSCYGFYGDWRDKDAGIIDNMPEEVEDLFKELAGW